MSITDADVRAAKEIYDIAKEQANSEIAKLNEELVAAKDDHFSLGIIKANKAHRDYSNFLDAVVLYRVHKNKAYRQKGLTWASFCEAAGYERRTADRIIADIAPMVEAFSDNLSGLAGITFNDIRYLGRTKTDNLSGFDENGNAIFGEEKIPFTPEDISAYIRKQKEVHKEELKEKDAQLKAKDRLIKSKQDHIQQVERDLALLERKVEKSDLTPEEQEAINLLQQVQIDFGLWLSDIKKKIDPEKSPDIALRYLYYLYIFISKQAMEERLALQEHYRYAEEVPWEITDDEIPPTEILLDNLPIYHGKNVGKAYKEKLEQRAARKNSGQQDNGNN